MIVRMKTTSTGPAENRYAGKEYPVSDGDGRALVDGGFAVEVKSAPVEAAVVEVATLPEPENAAVRVRPIVKKRR